jgi:hydrophobe/amphiphile efflux-1 (HAE1) family protein
MTLAELSIRRPVFAWMIMFGLIVFGGISFLRLGVSQMPDVDFPILTIAVNYPGAAPEIMETDIVDVIEDAVSSVEGLHEITSSSTLGGATVTLEFELDRNIDVALQEVQSKLAQSARLLPRDLDPPTITKTNPEDSPILWLALTSDPGTFSPRDQMAFTKDHLRDEFTSLPGVGDVLLSGYIDPNLRVWVDRKKLAGYALTVQDVITAVEKEHAELPAGYISDSIRERNVRTMGEAKSVKDFETIRLNYRGGLPNYAPIPLVRVARIDDGLADVRRVSRSNGQQAIGLGIIKQRGTNAVEVAKAVRAKMAALQSVLPKGMHLGVRNDTTKFISDSVRELEFTLLLSALLTGIVCWLFLGSWSATFNVLLSIPTSIIGTFTIIYFAGFTLNTFTMLALSLSIGIVVDDAIMVLENIIRHNEMGKPKALAARDGAVEITFAAIAATVAIIAIFLPVAFMSGIIGKYFFQFGVTMTAAVLLSLIEAITLTPMRCAQFVEVQERQTRLGRAVDYLFEKLSASYKRGLAVCVNHPLLVMIGATLFFFVSLVPLKMGLLRSEMVPAQDQSQFLVRLQMPPGSSMAFTNDHTKLVEDFLAKRPEVDGTFVAVGGFGNGGDPTTAIAFVSMKDKGKRGIAPELKHEATQQQFMGVTRTWIKANPALAGVIPYMQDLSLRGFSTGVGFPIEFTVRGPDLDQLGKYAAQMMKAMDAQGIATDIGTDYQLGKLEVDVVPNRQYAASRGVSVEDVGQTVQAMLGGVQVGRFERDGHRYDITISLPDENRDRVAVVNALSVRNNRGELVPMSQLVTITEHPSLQAITRKNRERAVTIWANVAKAKSQDQAIEEIRKLGLATMQAPYRVVFSGASQASADTRNSLIFAMLMGIVVAYMVLASQFNSFWDPVTVLTALPFSITGGLAGLLIADKVFGQASASLNMYSLIGFILLMGIVKKNSILLVEFTNQKREHDGLNIKAALLEACPVRLRPILMTSTATIAGAIPPALALGPGAETRIPMAVTVLGGVFVSTFLTLFVVPSAYLIFEWCSEALPLAFGWIFGGLFQGKPFPQIPSLAHVGDKGGRITVDEELDEADREALIARNKALAASPKHKIISKALSKLTDKIQAKTAKARKARA